jgi:cell division protein FtsB|tara:strand:- start:70 stop:333 length:264 start_codon:yes stop_codon:yes gene_type:complete
MEKIIFFSLVIPIFGFVLYLGATAIMKGFSAKSANRSDENIEDQNFDNLPNDENKLSDEIEKLNKLLNDGVLTQEEFEKAKKKLLDN